MTFVIPLDRDDLLKADQLNQYVVRNIYNIRELKTKLKEVELGVQMKGSKLSEIDGFDTIYSLLVHFHKELPDCFKQSGHELLLSASNHLIDRLDNVLGDDTIEKNEALNDMKMIVYLLTQLTELIESEHGETTNDPKRSSKKNQDWNWEQSRSNTVTVFYRLLQLNINRLFTPPLVEEDFINLIANCCFRFLENPGSALQRNKPLRTSIAQVLGTLNSKFEYSLSCGVKIVQELKLFEHLVSPLSELVHISYVEFRSKTLVMEVIREISRLDVKELNRDTSATRSYAGFLVELTEKLPEAVKPSLSLLIVHLEGEAYSMRKAVLSILGEIVLRVLSKEDLDDASKETRDSFLGYMEEHIHDVNAFVRSSVLQTWSKLCQAKAIPLSRQYNVLKLVIGRLHDKSSNVRKQAVQLLTSLLQCNPYTSSLPVEELQNQLKVESAKLEDMETTLKKKKEVKVWETELETEIENNPDLKDDDESETVWENAVPGEVTDRIKHLLDRQEFGKALSLLKAARKSFPDHFPEVMSLKDVFLTATDAALAEEESNAAKQRILVSYLKDSVAFGTELNESLPIMCQLLGSKQSSDVLEAISFFVTAFEFGLLKAMMGVRKMLALIWSGEAVVKDAVVQAYKRLYIHSDSAQSSNLQIVKNLIALLNGATVGELTSLEELIGTLVTSKDIGKECFQILWQIFTMVIPDYSTEETSCAAISILGMIAVKEPTVIKSNVQVIVDHAFTSGRGDKNFRLVSEACNALLKVDNVSDNTPYRFEADDPLFVSLERILVDGISTLEDRQYCPMAKNVISVIYQFSEHPDRRAADICRKLVHKSHSKIKIVIQRLLFVVGQIAISQLKHLDVAVFCELKRRNSLREMKQEKRRKRKSAAATANSASETPRNAISEEDAVELVGAEADDAEAEYIRSVCERELVTGDNLLALFGPFIVDVCQNSSVTGDLKTAASLTLAKFMLVSNEFCDSHLRLLFTMLEKSTEETIRANLIITTGDLSVRFPNTLEPWTPRMYARLRDESALVRSNTLTVLTHLILNDMVKVKGQISDMALCIIDDVDRISSLAKLFFTELARKGNSLYNVMPDIVSRLSHPDVGVGESQFREIMKFVICLIEKDKHLESLVEKMCYRYRVTKTERQWRDLSYCLSLFNFSDKAIKKLAENFNCYADKLYEPDVYSSFSNILTQAKKLAKMETKTMIEELENKIEEAHSKCLEDHNANQRAVESQRERSVSPEKPQNESESEAVQTEKSCKKRKSSAKNLEDSDSEVPNDIDNDESKINNGNNKRSRKETEKRHDESDSEDDDDKDEDEDEADDKDDEDESDQSPLRKSARKTPPTSGLRKKKQSITDESKLSRKKHEKDIESVAKDGVRRKSARNHATRHDEKEIVPQRERVRTTDIESEFSGSLSRKSSSARNTPSSTGRNKSKKTDSDQDEGKLKKNKKLNIESETLLPSPRRRKISARNTPNKETPLVQDKDAESELIQSPSRRISKRNITPSSKLRKETESNSTIKKKTKTVIRRIDTDSESEVSSPRRRSARNTTTIGKEDESGVIKATKRNALKLNSESESEVSFIQSPRRKSVRNTTTPLSSSSSSSTTNKLRKDAVPKENKKSAKIDTESESEVSLDSPPPPPPRRKSARNNTTPSSVNKLTKKESLQQKRRVENTENEEDSLSRRISAKKEIERKSNVKTKDRNFSPSRRTSARQNPEKENENSCNNKSSEEDTSEDDEDTFISPPQESSSHKRLVATTPQRKSTRIVEAQKTVRIPSKRTASKSPQIKKKKEPMKRR